MILNFMKVMMLLSVVVFSAICLKHRVEKLSELNVVLKIGLPTPKMAHA